MTLWASTDMGITTLFSFSLPPTARFAQNTLWQWTQTQEDPKLLLTLTTEGEFSEGEFNLFFKVLKLNWGWHTRKKILLCLKQFPWHCWKLFHGTYLSALELRRKSSTGDKSTQLAHQVFPEHLPHAFPKVTSTHNFSWLIFQRVCKVFTKWAHVLHLKIVAMWFI